MDKNSFNRVKIALLISVVTFTILLPFWFFGSIGSDAKLPFSWVVWITAFMGIVGLVFYRHLEAKEWKGRFVVIIVAIVTMNLTTNPVINGIVIAITFYAAEQFIFPNRNTNLYYQPQIGTGIFWIIIAGALFAVPLLSTNTNIHFLDLITIGGDQLTYLEQQNYGAVGLGACAATIGLIEILHATILRVLK